MEKIKIKIKKNGSIEYEVQGVKGKSCKDLTKIIDKLSKVVDTKNTPEYSQAEDPKERERYRG